MTTKQPKLGWIGTGRMGFEMAQRLAKASGAELEPENVEVGDGLH